MTYELMDLSANEEILELVTFTLFQIYQFVTFYLDRGFLLNERLICIPFCAIYENPLFGIQESATGNTRASVQR